MRIQILTFGLLWLSACGGGGLQEIQFSETPGQAGYVQLNVSDAVGAISQFRIQIEGDDFETITQTLSADAAGTEIRGIPAGEGRTIRIWALNEAGQTLREGILENVAIRGGQVQSFDISLAAVPFVLNLADGAYQSNRRLYFEILTDPNHRIGVEGYRDIAGGEEEKKAGSDGLVRFYPGSLPAGPRVFQIIDLDTDKKISLNLNLWEGQDVGPASFVAAGLGDASRLGQALVGEETFSNIVEVLWNAR
ncbi:MAG: hypothetical protein HY466_05355 [Deltaproteobacteria bacterium]|nr:hypothetical protein [Deltaproteobacteria bacterium]